jgi:hypothetical protein
LYGTTARGAWDARQRIPAQEVIGVIKTKPGSVTVPEEQDDAPLTLLIAISALEDSTGFFSFSNSNHWRKRCKWCRGYPKAMTTQRNWL